MESARLTRGCSSHIILGVYLIIFGLGKEFPGWDVNGRILLTW